MRLVTRALLAAVSLAATVTGLAAPAADAQSAATWTVNPGGKFTTAAASNYTFLTDTVTGVTFRCGGLAVSGRLASGTGLVPQIGTIREIITTGPCTGDSLDFNMINQTPMPIRASEYDPATGTTHGVIHDVDLMITSTACTASLTGLLRWHHQNNGNTLTITSPQTLSAANVTGCAGAIKDGDTFTNNSRFIMYPDEIITSP